MSGFCGSSFCSHTFNILICPPSCWPLSWFSRSQTNLCSFQGLFYPCKSGAVYLCSERLWHWGLCHFFVICHLLPHIANVLLIVWMYHVSHQICSSARISIMVSDRTLPNRCSSTNRPSSVTLPSLSSTVYMKSCAISISLSHHFSTAFLSSGFDHLFPRLLLQLSVTGQTSALFTLNPFSLMQPDDVG